MIIKSLSRRTGSSGQLIRYILRYMVQDEKQKLPIGNGKQLSPLIIQHNTRAKTIEGYIKAFERLNQTRLHKRVDNVQIYHTIISFSGKDKEHITTELLQDIARKFIELRGKDNIYVIAPHYDKEHIHLHAAISPVTLASLGNQQSRREYQELKLALDSYLRESYPLITHSFPDHGKKERLQKEQNRYEKNIKTPERESNKWELLQLLDTISHQAQSTKEFVSLLEAQGHTAYYRAGKLTGVKFQGDMKFRFSRLGVDLKHLERLDQKQMDEEKLLMEFDAIRTGRTQTKTRIVDIKEVADANEQSRLEEFNAIREASSTEREAADTREPDSFRHGEDDEDTTEQSQDDNESDDFIHDANENDTI